MSEKTKTHATVIVNWFSRKHNFRRNSAVRYVEQQLDQTGKQARAEVLAAVPKPLSLPLRHNRDFYRLTELNCLLEQFHKKEPAAADLEALLREERGKVATRLRHVADGYEQGGHTHRARAFRAIADEIGK